MLPPMLDPDPDVRIKSPPTVGEVAVEEPEKSLTSPAVPEEEATDIVIEPADPVPAAAVLAPVVREMLPELVPVPWPVTTETLPVIAPAVVEREIAPDVPVAADPV